MSAELLIQTDIIKFFKEFLNSPVFRTASVDTDYTCNHHYNINYFTDFIGI